MATPAKKETKASAAKPSPKTKKTVATKKTAAKEPAAKKTVAAKAGGSAKSKTASPKRVVKAIAEKSTEVLGEMLTGAAVGAVTAAAERVSDQPTAVTAVVAEPATATPTGAVTKKGSGSKKAATPKRGKGKPSGEVLGEMLSGAAVGAVAGAAKSVLPVEKKEGRSRPKGKK